MEPPKPPAKPNILIIMSDDQGPWAMNCAGTPQLDTPALNRLAAEGTRFENCFCASPVCSPARASFLTGRIPSSHGVHDWIKSGNIDVAEGVTWSGADRPIEYLDGLTAFTDILANQGYRCGLSGKWHLGASHLPQKSHSYWCAHSLGGDSYTDYFIFDNEPKISRQSQYVTDLFTDRAVDFLQAHGNDEQPFCLSVHYTAPHAPWRQNEQPADLWQHYGGRDFPLPVQPPHPWGGWDPSPEQRRETIQGYFTTITAMDTSIARLLDTLDALDIADNTLVFFTSDNGYSMGHHGIHGKGNGTYPMNMYEEAVKVPFIARCPGRIPGDVLNTDLVSHYDFMPTLLDYLSLDNPIAEDLPGQSFAPILRGESGGHGAVVVCDEYGPARMIRDQQWKYVHRYPDGPHELYNLENDPGENRNLVDDPAHVATLKHWRGELESWFRRYADPTRDGAGQPVTGRGQIDTVDTRRPERSSFV
ncbi:MAG: sulfatase-like hydrolase/transferase [Candidatus Latescibacteria bacterium]|nr:sulfatase-like hydrolase/transferase [Candidatus Latescibacterota bacterium]